MGFLSINPLGPGHTLVVPRREVDHWVDAEPELLSHLIAVSHTIASGIEAIWAPPRVGLIVAGFEVHTCTCTCSRHGTCPRSTSRTRRVRWTTQSRIGTPMRCAAHCVPPATASTCPNRPPNAWCSGLVAEHREAEQNVRP